VENGPAAGAEDQFLSKIYRVGERVAINCGEWPSCWCGDVEACHL